MTSQFRAHTLAEIFVDLYRNESSGVLVLEHGDVQKRVHFDRGMMAFAESPVEQEDLGRVLIDEGHLSAGALAEARASLQGGSTVRELSEVLVNRDLVSKTNVTRAMTSILDRVVRSVFRWEDGRASFQEAACEPSVFETDILTSVELILNGIFCMAGFDPIQEAMQALDNRLRIRDAPVVPVERLTLTSTHGYVLSRIDGNTTLAEVISTLPPGEEDSAARFVFGLLVMGVLEYDPPLGEGVFRVSDVVRDHMDRRSIEHSQEQMIRQQYDQVREQNPYEMLRVSPSASRLEVERAYERLKAQVGRDRLLPKVQEKLRTELSVIESRLIEAFLTLTQPDRGTRTDQAPQAEASREDLALKDLNVRVEIDRAKSKVELDNATRVADSYFAKGRKCMREGDFHNAIQYGKLAISHNPSDARYFCLLADCQARNPEHRWQRMAEENYARATQLDPWNAHYWMCLGRLYKKRGMKLRAKKQFEEALKLVPNKPEIIQELATLD